jgi:hypothetical protein
MNYQEKGVQPFSGKFHSRHCGIVPNNSGKDRKNCVTFALKWNMFERKLRITGTCPQRKSLRCHRSLASMIHISRTCKIWNLPVTETFSLRYCSTLSRFYCMYVIYKCDHGPQVGYLWSTERKLHNFSVMYNNILVINISNRTHTKH